MWPIEMDKCLIPFLGKPLLYHNLKLLKDHLKGSFGFIIVVNPQSQDKISQIAQSLNLNFQIVVQQKPLGMADAILSARKLLSGPILVINAEDILEKKAYQDVLAEAQKTRADVFFTGLDFGKYFPGGYLKLEADKVLGIVEKPGAGKEPSNIVKLVVDYFKEGKKLVDYLQKASSVKDDRYEVALAKMIDDGLNVRFASYKGVWIPIKYPWHILDATKHFLSGIEHKIDPGVDVPKSAVVEGPVVIEKGTKIFEGAVIKGPVYIGENCIIGNNSMVRESNLEEGCVTGFSSDITRSYIGPNSWFHTNYIGDSVIEGDFGMGSGAILANLRLDDKTIKVGPERLDTDRHKLGLVVGIGVRMGVNATTMPGVRVGSNSLIGPGVVLKKDLKENQRITVDEKSYEIRDYNTTHTGYDQFRDKFK